MSCLLRAQRRCVLVAVIGLSASLAGPVSAGEIFKCVAKDGTPLYQNFPCNIDSMGFAPSNPTTAKPGQDKAKVPAVAAVAANSARSGEVRAGMAEDEVRALMGEPEEMIEDEPGVGSRVMNWRYADGKIVQFDHKHRVLGVQR